MDKMFYQYILLIKFNFMFYQIPNIYFILKIFIFKITLKLKFINSLLNYNQTEVKSYEYEKIWLIHCHNYKHWHFFIVILYFIALIKKSIIYFVVNISILMLRWDVGAACKFWRNYICSNHKCSKLWVSNGLLLIHL